MSKAETLTAMRRKAGAGRDPFSGPAPSAARAWHTTMPRAADDLLGLELSVLAVQETLAGAEAQLADVDESSLLLLMRCDGGRSGVCALDAEVLAAVIEMHMTGAVGSAAPAPRRPTPTDAAIASGFVDAVCAAFEGAMADAPAPSPFAGARCGGFLGDRRAALMALPEGPVHRVRVAVDLGGRARQGQFALLMPALATAAAGRGGETARSAGRDLVRAAMDGHVALEAVLHRLRLPLARVRGLQPGDLLPIPASALLRVSVEAGGGRRIARARLGQTEGRKALRLDLAAAAGEAIDRSSPEIGPGAPGPVRHGPDARIDEGGAGGFPTAPPTLSADMAGAPLEGDAMLPAGIIPAGGPLS